MPARSNKVLHLRRRAESLGFASRELGARSPQIAPAATAPAWPHRPDPSVLSNSIPVFFIGKTRDGFWVARDAGGRCGGLFLRQHSAVQFARARTALQPCATMHLTDPFELDIANEGNPLIGCLRSAMQWTRAAWSRLSATVAGAGQQRLELERELYQGRYKLSSKCDDDLPILR